MPVSWAGTLLDPGAPFCRPEDQKKQGSTWKGERRWRGRRLKERRGGGGATSFLFDPSIRRTCCGASCTRIGSQIPKTLEFKIVDISYLKRMFPARVRQASRGIDRGCDVTDRSKPKHEKMLIGTGHMIDDITDWCCTCLLSILLSLLSEPLPESSPL